VVVSENSPIAVLEADPDLGDRIPADEREVAGRALVAPSFLLAEGPWDPAQVGRPPVVGLLVVQGVLTREIVFAGRASTELLGAGDVLRPWDNDVKFDALPFGAAWHVHQPCRIALLDTRFALAMARWPPLAAAIGARHVRRARGMAFQLVLSQLPRVDDRLLALLWYCAERWGRVTPEGVRLPLALPHRTLAALVGARRPSVTTALGGLARERLVEREPDGWLLHGEPGEVLGARLGMLDEVAAAG